MGCAGLLGSIVVLILASNGWAASDEFVKCTPTSFSVGGSALSVNGFNAYWMPYMALQNSSIVSKFLRQAAGVGLNVARTWAFRDGGYNAMQTSLGVYDEKALQGLDFVVSEASKNNIRLILAFVNNYGDLGGRPQYVKWAKESGVSVNSDDDFYKDATIKLYYKKYIAMILNRKNTITGLTYKEDPTIFSWELINEPRTTDSSGDTLHSWITEMAAHVKSIDANHLLEIGLEGFYSKANPSSSSPGSWSEDLGTDFIRNNQIPEIDFATAHIYPDNWIPGETFEKQLIFVSKWIENHAQDAGAKLKKPVMFAEFGKSERASGYEAGHRVAFFSTVYAGIAAASEKGLPSAGSLLWQLFADEIDSSWNDGFQILLSKDSSIASLIRGQSTKLGLLADP